MQHAQRFLKLIDTIRKTIQETSVAEVKNKFDNRHNFVLVDVREDSEWLQGHIPNAIHLSKGIIERDIEKAIPDPNTEIVLYCGGGFRSALAAESLQKMGYVNVISMEGGIRAWINAGLPLQT